MLLTLISRIITVFMSVVVLLSGGKYGEVNMEITAPVVTSSSRIELDMRNNTGQVISLTKSFKLEKLEDGEWRKDWMDEGAYIIIPDIAISVPPFVSHRETIDLGRQDIFLKTGTYRLTKEYDTMSETNRKVSVIFEIEE